MTDVMAVPLAGSTVSQFFTVIPDTREVMKQDTLSLTEPLVVRRAEKPAVHFAQTNLEQDDVSLLGDYSDDMLDDEDAEFMQEEGIATESDGSEDPDYEPSEGSESEDESEDEGDDYDGSDDADDAESEGLNAQEQAVVQARRLAFDKMMADTVMQRMPPGRSITGEAMARICDKAWAKYSSQL